MGNKTTAVTVGTSATRLDTVADGTLPAGQLLTYYNAGAVDVWIGDANVAAGNGIRLAPGGTASERLPFRAKRWAVVASGTCQVNVDQVWD